ncbi:PspC domain-containing protein [Candidatus Albibeggiatoa sp. nov. NOAA]|uniref:PspC domain-containing protein n=1 Tax=Candidatus Albibeggiatoa sp. nov. NOAA TaxID=3162724 RepID=UPI003300FFB4|nr:PspC domain-containing protein [Thiotrichaceae bacterium]
MKIKPILYRNSTKGKLFGVCAGWAEFLRQDVGVIRTLTVIFALFPLTAFITIFSYIVMAMMLDDKPTPVVVEVKKVDANKNPTEALDEIEELLQDLENKVMDVEHYVTSEPFEFQCKLWALKSE